MSEPKHTPGPWRPDHRLIGGQIRITQERNANMTVAQVNGRKGEQEANARLIAAAPELLEALDDYVAADTLAIGHGYGVGGEVRDKARALIARLKGET